MQIRCPHCRNAIEVLGSGSSLDKVSCQSCGHSFNLTHNDTLVQTESQPPGTSPEPPSSFAHFQLLEVLGTGAFGTVWRARDKKLDRIVALKIPRHAHIADQNAEQFLREARAAAQLKHPNIVSVHEVGRSNGLVYIVSDFIEGVSMDDWLKEERPGIKDAISICIKLANALFHAHELGIIHRDLKPANVLIDTAGEPHLTDFGLAKRIAGEITMTVEGKILGTPAYMPPEQAAGDGHNADCRSDVYSLGVILYEVLTGERPFRGNISGVLSQVLHDEPQSPRTLDQQIPRDLETITLKCLEKKPARRFQSAQELSEELQRFLQGEPILSRPISSMNRVWRWVQRKPASAGFVSSVAILLMVLSVGGPIVASREKSLRIESDKSSKQATDSAIRETKANQVAQKETARAKLEEKRTRQQVQISNKNLYMAHMRLAMQDLTARNIKNVRSLLDKHVPQSGEPDYRSFEWYYLWKKSHPPVKLLRHDKGIISATAFNSNGKIFYTFSSQGTVKAWDLTTNRVLFSLKVFPSNTEATGLTKAMLPSPNGQLLATGDKQGQVKLWDATTGKDLAVLDRHKYSVMSLAFSDDSKWLASGDRAGTVHLWDVEKQTHVAEVKPWFKNPNSRIWGLAFSGKGRSLLIAGGSDGTVMRWNPDNGKWTHDFLAHPQMETLWFVVSPDKRWALTSDFNKSTHLWDLSIPRTDPGAFKPAKTFSNLEWPRFSPDSKTFCGIKSDTIYFWDVESLQLQGTVQALVSPTTAAFTPDGNRIVLGGGDGTVKLLDVPKKVQTSKLGDFSPTVVWTALSPDEKTGAVSGYRGDKPKFWNLETGEPLVLLATDLYRNGKTIKKLRPGEIFGATNEVVIWSPNGKYLSTSGFNGTAIFDAKTRKRIFYYRANEESLWANLAVEGLAFSPDSRQLAVGYGHGAVRLFDVGQQKVKYVLRESLPSTTSRMVLSLDFSPDGKRVIGGGQDYELTVWDVETGKEVQSFASNQRGFLSSVKYSPDGTLIASLANGLGVEIWDAQTFEQKNEFKLPNVYGDLAFTPDGKRVLASVRDGIIVCDIDTGEQVVKLQAEGTVLREIPGAFGGGQPQADPVLSLAISPDGTKVLTGGGETVNLWKAASPKEVADWNSLQSSPLLKTTDN